MMKKNTIQPSTNTSQGLLTLKISDSMKIKKYIHH